jgi:hypothetical protein
MVIKHTEETKRKISQTNSNWNEIPRELSCKFKKKIITEYVIEYMNSINSIQIRCIDDRWDFKDYDNQQCMKDKTLYDFRRRLSFYK